MMTNAAIRQFGAAVPAQTYVLRPGGYGVIFNREGLAAVILTPRGGFLPGGGQEGDESPQHALRREAREECGFVLEVGTLIGIADELVFAASEKVYYRKRCTFFSAVVLATTVADIPEQGHHLAWLPREEAAVQIVHESQRWALQFHATVA